MRAHAAILGLAAVLAGLGPHALAGEDRAGTPEVVNTLEKLAASRWTPPPRSPASTAR